MQIFVKTLQGRCIELNYEPSSPIAGLKLLIEEKWNIPPAQQTLVAQGRRMDDEERTLSDYNYYPHRGVLHLVIIPPKITKKALGVAGAAAGASTDDDDDEKSDGPSAAAAVEAAAPPPPPSLRQQLSADGRCLLHQALVGDAEAPVGGDDAYGHHGCQSAAKEDAYEHHGDACDHHGSGSAAKGGAYGRVGPSGEQVALSVSEDAIE